MIVCLGREFKLVSEFFDDKLMFFTEKSSSIGVESSVSSFSPNFFIEQPISLFLRLELFIMHENEINFGFQISNLFLLQNSLSVGG